MTMKDLALAVLLAMPLGCGTDAQQDDFDLSGFRFLVPIASGVSVSADGTYTFVSINPEPGGEALGSCTLSLGLDPGALCPGLEPFAPIPDTVLASFQRAFPRESDDFFSIRIQGDSVSWGLFARGPVEGRPDALGKEWTNQPGGTLQGRCELLGTFVRCAVSWDGMATENFTSEETSAEVFMRCLFAPSNEPPCFKPCADEDPCTADACLDSECVHLPFEGAICELDSGVEGRCTDGAECVAR